MTAVTNRALISAILGCLGALSAAGCAGTTLGSGAEGSCALIVHFQGRTYEGNGVKIVPRPGRPLGVATLPGCNDGGGADGPSQIRVSSIPGVSPAVAVQAAPWNDVILLRDKQGVTLPTAVTHLFHAPRCRPADAPIRMRGTWGGIAKPGGGTELSMIPPYDVQLLVRTTSSSRYARAFLTVRVPPSLGRPLTKHDVHVSLWKQGDISATVGCRDGLYVATAVTAFPGKGTT